jgi:hypothetical protein
MKGEFWYSGTTRMMIGCGTAIVLTHMVISPFLDAEKARQLESDNYRLRNKIQRMKAAKRQ